MDEVLYCPRCGANIVIVGQELRCRTCVTVWSTKSSFGRECIARDMAGTRAVRATAEWLNDASLDGTGEGLGREMLELVGLVRYTLIEEIQEQVLCAIRGRYNEDEMNALRAMHEWLGKLKEGYGVGDL